MAHRKENLSRKTTFAKTLQSYGLVAMIVVMIFIFTILNKNFLTLSNIQNVIEQNAALAIVAVGITFCIISTAMDLSPASVIALTGVVIAMVFRDTGSLPLALAAGVIIPMCIGIFNGFMITKIGINPVIVTLAAYIWARGLALALTEKDSIVIQSPFINFMNQRLFGLVSPPMVLVVIMYIIGILLLYKTRLGRYTYAIGGGEQAARQAGIPVDRYKILIFLFSGFLVGIGAIITISRMGAAQPNAVYGLELDAIAAVIIGGTSLKGGEGGIRQTIIGVIFLAFLNNGLSTMGLRDASFYFFKGMVILFALFFEVTSRQMLKQIAAETIKTVEETT